MAYQLWNTGLLTLVTGTSAPLRGIRQPDLVVVKQSLIRGDHTQHVERVPSRPIEGLGLRSKLDDTR